MAKHTLIISDQERLVAGNQVLVESIRGYMRGGYDVTLLIRRKQRVDLTNTTNAPVSENGRTLNVHEFGSREALAFDRIRTAAVALSGKRPVRSHSFPESDACLGFERTVTSPWWLTYARYRILWRDALQAALQIAQERHVDCAVGYEIGGSVAATRLGRRLGIPVINKFLGTIALPFMKTGDERAVYTHLVGLRSPATWWVVHDDGTGCPEALRRLGVPPEKTRVWVDGVRMDMRSARSTDELCRKYGVPLKPGELLFGTLSNHDSAYKRLDRVIRAVAAVRDRLPCRIVLAHRGALTPSYEALGASLGIQDRLHFIGSVPHAEVGTILNGIDGFLHTNDVSNRSHPVLEAVVCGVPVVTLADGTLTGIVTDGVSGFLIPPEKCSMGLPNAMVRLGDHEVRASMRAEALRHGERLQGWPERMQMELDLLLPGRAGPG